jgi:hypothetical protein
LFSNLFERRPLKTAASSLMLSLVVALTAAKTPRLMAEPILVPASAQVVARNIMPSPRDKAASAVPSATTSASVACTNTASDIGLLQAAVNGGGTVTVSGNCSVSGGSVNINNPVSITGSATIIANPAATNFTFFINVDNVSINGLTFVAAGIRLTGANTSARTNVNLTNNTFRDFGMNPIGQAMNAAVWVDPIWRNSKFTGNTLKNLWYGGFSNTNAANVCSLGGSTLCDNTHESMYFFGVFFFGGLDNTQIEFNTFSQISGNGVKGFNNGLSAIPGGYQAAGTSVSYNTFTYIHRIGIEIQNCNSPGTTCNGFGNVYLTPKFAGNYFHSPAWGFIDTYAFSLPVIGTGSQFINNAAIGDFSGNATHTVARLGYAFEEPPGTGCCGTNVWDGSAIEQGNLVASDINSSDSSNAGWYAGFVNYGSAAAQTHQYNVMCGPNWNETVTNAPSLNEVDQYNYKSASCPSGSGAALFASSITAQTGTPTTAGSVETFPLAVISGLPIRNVQFSVDGISASIQEIADGNTNFQNDRKWLYHATVNVASMASGSHTLSAVVTDVSGTAQPYTQSFALGTTVVGKTASSSGTTIPSATQIVDASGIVWTVASGFSYENGTADGGSNITLLLYFNGGVYADSTAYGWWSHAKGIWQSIAGDPRPASVSASASGTTIPSATQIIDASGIVWTVASGLSYQNGIADGGVDITLLLYFNGSVYADTPAYGWWSHAKGSWQAVSGDPRPANSSGSASGTTIPSAKQIIDASGIVWTVASGSSYENGTADGGADIILLLYFNGSMYADTSLSAGGHMQREAGKLSQAIRAPRVAAPPRVGPLSLARRRLLTPAALYGRWRAGSPMRTVQPMAAPTSFCCSISMAAYTLTPLFTVGGHTQTEAGNLSRATRALLP